MKLLRLSPCFRRNASPPLRLAPVPQVPGARLPREAPGQVLWELDGGRRGQARPIGGGGGANDVRPRLDGKKTMVRLRSILGRVAERLEKTGRRLEKTGGWDRRGVFLGLQTVLCLRVLSAD